MRAVLWWARSFKGCTPLILVRGFEAWLLRSQERRNIRKGGEFVTSLERIGELYPSKSGKGLNIKVTDDPRTIFTYYLTMSKQAVQDLLNNKRATVPIMLVTASKRPQSAAGDPDL